MRATHFCLLVFVALAFTAHAALASGPVFVVVPTTPAELRESAPTQVSAPSGRSDLPQELRATRRALARARRTVRRLSAAVVRERRATVSSLGLSNWLEVDKRAVQVGLAEQSALARRDRLQQRIAALEREARPVPPPTVELSMPSFGAPLGVEAVSIAEQYLGVPYLWGGSTPAGFDCSGLTMYVYAQLGIQLPHYAAAQWNEGMKVDPSALEPGDLVFFEPTAAGPGHVAIYAGGDQIIEAPDTGDVVKLASLSETAASLGFVGAVRPASVVASLFP